MQNKDRNHNYRTMLRHNPLHYFPPICLHSNGKNKVYYLLLCCYCQVNSSFYLFFVQRNGDTILGCSQPGLEMIKYMARSKGSAAPLWITHISLMTGSYNTLIASCYYAHILLQWAMSRCASYCYSSHKALPETGTEKGFDHDITKCLWEKWHRSFEATWFCYLLSCVININ